MGEGGVEKGREREGRKRKRLKPLDLDTPSWLYIADLPAIELIMEGIEGCLLEDDLIVRVIAV